MRRGCRQVAPAGSQAAMGRERLAQQLSALAAAGGGCFREVVCKLAPDPGPQRRYYGDTYNACTSKGILMAK